MVNWFSAVLKGMQRDQVTLTLEYIKAKTIEALTFWSQSHFLVWNIFSRRKNWHRKTFTWKQLQTEYAQKSHQYKINDSRLENWRNGSRSFSLRPTNWIILAAMQSVPLKQKRKHCAVFVFCNCLFIWGSCQFTLKVWPKRKHITINT